MHDIAFADAARPATVVCLQLPLRPYSLGHELLLLQQRNPLLLGSREEFNLLPFSDQRQALFRAALICSNTWKLNHRPQRWMFFWKWKIRKTIWPLENAEFRNYLAAGRTGLPGPDPEADLVNAKFYGYPPLKEAKGRAHGAPVVAQLLHFVQQLDLDYWGFETVYDFPFALANMLYVTSLETTGAARVENLEDFEERENLEKIKRDYEAEQRLQKESSKSKVPSSKGGLATKAPDLNSGVEKNELGKQEGQEGTAEGEQMEKLPEFKMEGTE